MKQYLIYGLFFVLSNYAIGQNLDREKCFQEFRAKKSNAKQYQMNGALYVNPYDVTRTPVVDSIYFFEAYCRGFEDAHKNNYILTPGRYIDFVAVAEDGIAFDEKMVSLTLLLKQQMQKANELDEAIKLNLKKIGYGW